LLDGRRLGSLSGSNRSRDRVEGGLGELAAGVLIRGSERQGCQRYGRTHREGKTTPTAKTCGPPKRIALT